MIVKYSNCVGPILESKGMRTIFKKKVKKKKEKKMLREGKVFENLGKDVQKLKIFWKRAGDCVHNRTQ